MARESVLCASAKEPLSYSLIGDNTSAASLFRKLTSMEEKKKMEEERSGESEEQLKGPFFLFQGTYNNLKDLHASLLRRVKTKFTPKEKGTSKSVFLSHRKYKEREAETMGRLLFAVDKRGVPLHVHKMPTLSSLQHLLYDLTLTLNKNNNKRLLEEVDGFAVSFSHFLGLNGAEQWKEKGVSVAALRGLRVHPFYNVFAPTQQQHLDLFKRFLKKTKLLKEIDGPVLDIGTGTGVLTFILCQRKESLHVVGTDNSEESIQCAQWNAKELQMEGNTRFVLADVFPSEDTKFQLIVCNPPFLPGETKTRLDTAVYDPERRFLKKLLSELKNHLLEDGKLLLLFSNDAVLLGVESEDIVKKLCEENSLRILKRMHSSKNMKVKKEQSTEKENNNLQEERTVTSYLIGL